MTELFLAYDAFLRSAKQNIGVRHVFLLGAGASTTSGVKSADDCIWEWKRDIFVSKNPALASLYKQYKTDAVKSSIQAWLDNEGCYPKTGDPEEYSKYALEANPIEAVRKKYFDNICRNKEPYVGYKLLCLLAQFGMVHSIFTTNFDGLMAKAAHQMGITPIEITLDTSDRTDRPDTKNELPCIALHGDFKFGPLKNTCNELDAQDVTFTELLSHHLYDKHLIVSGYSGRDQSLMRVLKQAYSKKGSGILFWCGYGDNFGPEIENLVMSVRQSGRDAYLVPTDGFDNLIIHLTRICFTDYPEYVDKMNRTLRVFQENETPTKSSFVIDSKHANVVIRSNLFPVNWPKEVYQFQIEGDSPNNLEQTINVSTVDSRIMAAPLKGMVYAFSTLSDIHSRFKGKLVGEVKRTPVVLDELKRGAIFKQLYRRTIIKGICEVHNLMSDGHSRIWKKQAPRTIIVNGSSIKVFDAARISLFFDAKNVYISLQPTFVPVSNENLTQQTLLAIGQIYNAEFFKTQPNIRFNAFLDHWKRILFPKGHLRFEYPPLSGSGFRFAVGHQQMHVGIMKSGTERGFDRWPQHFNKNTLIHNGIQYLEPQLEFTHKYSGRPTKDFHPMRGLVNNRPYDFPLNGNIFESEINLGIICPLSYSGQLFDFLNRLNQKQNAGASNPDYLLDYPGFFNVYGIPLNIPDPKSERWQNCGLPTNESNLISVARNLLGNIKKCIDRLDTLSKKLVVVIFIPSSWNDFTKIAGEQENFDLHDHIKAYTAQKGIPTQFIREDTLGDPLLCQVNWWLSLSFYVKASRTPWILTGLENNTAFVGMGYSVNHREKKDKVVLGCSHIYNAQGQGLKYRLTRVGDCYIDRRNNPYLSYNDAYKFGVLIRELFFHAMGDLPKRVVIHKRTHFKKQEADGIIDSLKKSGIDQIDLVEITFEANARFISLIPRDIDFQPHPYPLSRGSCFLQDNTTALLWTHGIVPSVKSERLNYYLGGKNIPVPLKITKHYGISNISVIATEILGLTKMNWNSFDLYSKLPATIHTSNEIARIGWLLSRFEGKTYDYRHFM